MVLYIDVERLVREVYRLPIDDKLAATLDAEELVRRAVGDGILVSELEYEAHLVDTSQPETDVHDTFMQESEFWDC